jgi:hypothetical protein
MSKKSNVKYLGMEGVLKKFGCGKKYITFSYVLHNGL